MTPLSRPLVGVVVLDLGQIYNGPYAALLMAKAGATVIKVEPPRGDLLRGRIGTSGGDIPFRMLNSNKLGMTVNLKNASGRELFLDLAQRADIIIENFRPGTLTKLDLSPESLLRRNPRLVIASGPGYAENSIYSDYMAMDLTIQAMSGAMAVTGYPDRPPVKAGPALADFLGGVHLYAGAITALLQSRLTGVGQHVEVPMLDATVPSLMSSIGLYAGSGFDGVDAPRTANRHSGSAEAPYDMYAASDGYVAVMCVSDDHWARFADAIDRRELIDDPQFDSRHHRVQNIDELTAAISAWTEKRSRQDIVTLLKDRGVPCGPVRDLSEVMHDPYLAERGILVWGTGPDGEVEPELGSPLRFESPRVEFRKAPQLGADRESVLHDLLGLDEAAIETLAASGAW